MMRLAVDAMVRRKAYLCAPRQCRNSGETGIDAMVRRICVRLGNATARQRPAAAAGAGNRHSKADFCVPRCHDSEAAAAAAVKGRRVEDDMCAARVKTMRKHARHH